MYTPWQLDVHSVIRGFLRDTAPEESEDRISHQMEYIQVLRPHKAYRRSSSSGAGQVVHIRGELEVLWEPLYTWSNLSAQQREGLLLRVEEYLAQRRLSLTSAVLRVRCSHERRLNVAFVYIYVPSDWIPFMDTLFLSMTVHSGDPGHVRLESEPRFGRFVEVGDPDQPQEGLP